MTDQFPDPERTDLVMHRREAIKRVSALFGGVALVGGSALWTACTSDRSKTAPAGAGDIGTFTPTDVAYLDEIAETILPETNTPGAKAAQVGAFIALMVTDCYTPADQDAFRTGMKSLDDACRAAHAASFLSVTPAQRLALLEGLDREAKTFMDTKAPDAPTHYFRMMKELTLLGYFTSEIGYTKAMRYIESPGRFDPCVPHTAGETIWADHA